MNRTVFFDRIRANPFGGSLSQSQVDGITKILDEWERRKLGDVRWLAYMLATAFHETGRVMQPIREAGSEAYLRSKPYYPWVGEGLIQVTWEENAKKFGATQPGDCMTWPVALRALLDGMINGMFTGRQLSFYFSQFVDDPVNARSIVNGTNKADLIAGYHKAFLAALKAAGDGQSPVTPPPPDISAPERPAAPPPVINPPQILPSPQPSGLWAWLKRKF